MTLPTVLSREDEALVEPLVAPLVESWRRAAERLYARYQLEIVEAYNLCPWAAAARRGGRVTQRVLLQLDGALGPALDQLAEIAGDARIEVALLLFPRLASSSNGEWAGARIGRVGRGEFEDFASRLQRAEANRHPVGAVPFASATFHPDAEPDVSEAERLIPFLRRTPDPTLQLVRISALDEVRSEIPQGTQLAETPLLEQIEAQAAPGQLPLRERIARANLATTKRVGVAELESRFRDICRDRDETYRRLEESG